MAYLDSINFESLLAGRWILLALCGLSIWIWVLAIVTMINLHWSKKKLADGIIAEHSNYCQQLNREQLRKPLKQHLAHLHCEILLKRTIEVIAQIGIAENSELTAGISMALVTTQGGLLVAIPGILVGSVLYRKAGKLRNALIFTSSRVTVK